LGGFVTSFVDTIILFGGSSSERRVSVASAQHLSSIITEAALWFWAQNGSVFQVTSEELMAHQNPYDNDFVPRRLNNLAENVETALEKAGGAVLYLCLHGGDGENGWLQTRLEARRIPFTGSGATASKIAMHKSESKEAVVKRGILVARQLLFSPSENRINELLKFQKEVGRLVIKPACDGSSAGLSFLNDEAGCRAWFEKHASSASPWLAEEELIGRELTVGVMMHQGTLTALPPSEVILEKNAHFDFQAKYHGVGNREITPADLTPAQTSAAQAVALIAHQAIGCFGYTRTDMIMTSSGIYYLETNTLPGMTKASFIPQQLRAAGIELRDFVDGQINLARKRFD
jgi:D-alanine-D-alanine ligase